MQRLFTSLLILSCALMSMAQIDKAHEPYLKKAVFLSEMRFHDSAVSVLEDLEEKLTKSDSVTWYYVKHFKAEFLTKAHRFSEAIVENEAIMTSNMFKATADSGRWFDMHNQLGIAYKNIGQLNQSVSMFNKAVKYDPSVPFIYTNLAGALILKEDYTRALKVLDYVPDTVVDVYARAVAYKAKCLVKLDRASEARNILLPHMEETYFADDYLAQLVMGKTFMALNESEKACEHFKLAQSMQNLNFIGHEKEELYIVKVKLEELMQLQMDINKCP